MMNADDHARAKALAADLQEVQRMLQRWARENQALADENEQLKAKNVRLPPQPTLAKSGDPTYLTARQLGERWGMHHESILRKIRNRDLPCLKIGNRVRIAMTDILHHETRNCPGGRNRELNR